MDKSTKRILEKADALLRSKPNRSRPSLSERPRPKTKAKKPARRRRSKAPPGVTSRDRQLRTIYRRKGVAAMISEIAFGEEFHRELLDDAILKDEMTVWAVASRRGMSFENVKGRPNRVVAVVDED